MRRTARWRYANHSFAAQYNNPQETYNYYYLPFCKPAGAGKAVHKWGGLGEVLEGNQLIDSQLDVKYRCEWLPLVAVTAHAVCMLSLRS